MEWLQKISICSISLISSIHKLNEVYIRKYCTAFVNKFSWFISRNYLLINRYLLINIVYKTKSYTCALSTKKLSERIFTFNGSMIVKGLLLRKATNPQYLHINIHQRFLVPLCSFCAGAR